jgi:DeoR/GlpR family transcriptional regulator of sugar metabolism
VAGELADLNGNMVILVGGELLGITKALIGPLAISSIRQFRADRAIIGMSGLAREQGFFTVNPYEAEVKRAMLELAAKSTVVMDSSKAERAHFSFVCGFGAVDQLVIDKDVPEETVRALEKDGMEVIVTE